MGKSVPSVTTASNCLGERERVRGS